MAVIHIEPVPPRCSPGVVLAFVCTGANLASKYVGKIAFVGRGASVEVPDANTIIIRGADKQKVGQFAAEVRAVRKPEPYKGKGIRYENEQVRRKEGKSFTSGG